MMKAHELFREMKPETARSVFQYLRDEQREAYTAALSSLAANRKLRPVFIQRKPAADQVAWLAKHVQLKGSDEVAERVVQLWLMKAHPDLLVSFLDGVGIEHDGEGAAEDIPDELDAKRLESTVDELLKENDPELVCIYLHAFQLQSSGGWPEIDALVASRPELQFGDEEAEPATAGEEE